MTLIVPPCSQWLAAFALGVATHAHASSLHFLQNAPEQYDFVDIPRLPTEFGRGEFTFEIWIKPDDRFPVGSVARSSYGQLINWANNDPEPYSDAGWWIAGNWLLDGYTRPHGFDVDDTREGSFGLQLYGGGRLRWTFADSDGGPPIGKVWAVQVYPASNTPSLLDGRWHHVACVRRWRDPDGARLELWIDGRQIASQDIPKRIDMRRYWDALPHPQNPKKLGGWCIGSEVMTAWNYAFTQFEDYKGLVDEIQMWGRARTPDELSLHWREAAATTSGLLAHFTFGEGQGNTTVDRIDPTYRLTLHRRQLDSWSPEDAPVIEAH
jgi:hypothetical protein